MLTNTITLSGTVVVEGVAFSWWVTDGLKPRLTVSNGLHGTETLALKTKPKTQARAVALRMLAAKARPAAASSTEGPGGKIELGEDQKPVC
jgi:hypothetical protein